LLSKAEELVKRTIGTDGGLYEFLAKAYTALVGPRFISKAEVLNKKATSWLHDNHSNFFLWLHYMDVHEPCGVSSRFISPLRRARALALQQRANVSPTSITLKDVSELIDLYDREIHYVDKALASLVRSLKRDGFLDNTFVIVTADHGQQFMEHGRVFHDVNLYDELVHVPLIVIGPGLGSCVIKQQVSLLDLAPTILDMLDIEKPKAFLGKSLLPLMMGKTEVGDLTAISEEGRNRRGDCDTERPKLYPSKRKISLRTIKWKYIYTEGGEDEMYHLENDPRETQNMIDIEPEVARGLRNMIMDHIEFEDKSTPGEEELIKAKIGKLKSSGKL
jgi:arylsulfatase A-like enzyme